MVEFNFQTDKRLPDGEARTGQIQTAHSTFPTPVFMPVGTVGSVKGIAPWEIEKTGSGILLSNTYHLYLRPGTAVIENLGGLHKMMSWNGSILTDSGGYQVFSLSALKKLSEEGVEFRSHIDGSKHLLTPEKAIEIQEVINSDIMMVLDECPPKEADYDYAARSMDMTTRWAHRCFEARKGNNALFAIVQGAMHPELRAQHAQQLADSPFDGLAIGGLSVGEDKDTMQEMLAASIQHLPAQKPRYFMGVGRPADILHAVSLGVDMFDCVLPTRSGRTGLLFTSQGELNIKNARHRDADDPVDPNCNCPACSRFCRGYLRHLHVAGEMLGPILNTLHNLHFYQNLMADIRAHIAEGTFGSFWSSKAEILSRKI